MFALRFFVLALVKLRASDDAPRQGRRRTLLAEKHLVLR
jgi:hypothetical protein